MKYTRLLATLGAGFCVLTALSCSSALDGGQGAQPGPTATSKSVVTSGVIQGFGSVKVMDQEYGTQNTSFMVDGQPGSQNALKVGMVVTIYGSISSDTGTKSATTITQEDVVEGAIQSIPASNDRIVVLGQTVLIDEDTLFDTTITPGDLSGLAPGQLVEVNGFVKDKGVMIATLIEKKSTSATCTVKGIVENHNSATQSFTIGGLTVNYSGAVFSDMPSPAGNAWNTALVKVIGSPCDQFATTMNATKVEPERLNVANADEVHIQGAITLFNSPASFSLNGVPNVTNASSKFEGGVAGDLALGAQVGMEGVLSNGVPTVGKIMFRNYVQIEGDAATVTSGGVSPNLTVSGLPGITVFVSAQTRFQGGISDLSQLLVSDHVRVRGRPTGLNTVIATEVEKLSPATQVILEGRVQSIANPNVRVLGVLIGTSLIPGSNFIDSINGWVIGPNGFFTTVDSPYLVKATGTLTSGSVVWSEIDITADPDCCD
jgi:hypothetical protein